MSNDAHSVTRWVEQLHKDDPQAAFAIWERFLERMLTAARRRLGSARRTSDEEDAVVIAFERFLTGVRQGRFPQLSNRDDLWAILLTLTERIALTQRRDQTREKRGGGQVRGDSALADGGNMVADDPTPEEAVLVQENLALLLGALRDDELRQIALLRMEGFSNAEIAQQIKRSEPTVERRLKLIRETWEAAGLAP